MTERFEQLKSTYGSAELHPITLTVSPGRCGTVFLQKLFSRTYGDAGEFLHERLSAHASQPATFFRSYDESVQREMLNVDAIYEETCRILESARQRPVVECGHYFISAVPLFHSLVPQALRVLTLHRHPVQSAGSHAIKGHYTINKSRMWAITPTHDRVAYPEFADRWETMSAFEKELYRWLETTSYGLELPEKIPGLKWKVVTSREMFKSVDLQKDIAEFCGLPQRELHTEATNKNETTDYNRETTPIRDEWRKTLEHKEVVQLAESLGYDMSLPTIEKLVKSYQAPSDFGALLRRYSGYWHLRRMFANVRRWASPSGQE